MSEHPPRTSPEHAPHEHPEPAPDLDQALAANTVPPTPKPPAEAVAETRERLDAHHESHEGEPATQAENTHVPAATPATPTTKATGTVAQAPKRSFWKSLPGPVRGGVGIFAFFWLHIVWPAAKWTMENFDLGKGGGGGGHKKDDHGHGHGGGGHH